MTRRGCRAATLLAAQAWLLLGGCASVPPAARPTAPAAPWAARLVTLQQANQWSLDGRAAASAGKQGWQASVDWRQRGDLSELHLAGPLGVGATVLQLTPDGLSIDGAAPRSDVAEAIQDRLGVELPLASLRYWLLGVPDPTTDAAVTRNAADRASQLVQSGWTVDIARYLPVGGDWLPAQLSVYRDAVRVKVAVDHWDFPR
jgi:outer membrane lipoprotein LolB